VAGDEADLLLAWAVDGAARLIRQRNFSIPGSSKTALFDWIYGADPVLAWLDERVEIRPTIGDPPNVRTRYAYEQFQSWAVAKGFRRDALPGINGFVQRITANARGVKYRRTSEGRFFTAMFVRHFDPPSPYR
jgi:putative DNA primase/helicase